MTQRNPMNDRYTEENRTGKTRKSSASAKPKAERAATVREPAPKTKEQKKKERKERERKEAEGKEYKRPVKSVWAIVTVQGILDNDFYIGTMRQSKYTRKKINGADIKKDVSEQIVIENHHQAIITYRDFRIAQELRHSRSKSDYRGVKNTRTPIPVFSYAGTAAAPCSP